MALVQEAKKMGPDLVDGIGLMLLILSPMQADDGDVLEEDAIQG